MQPLALVLLTVVHDDLSMHVFLILFSLFVLPFLVYFFFNTSCFLDITTPLPELEKPKPKPEPEPEPEPEQDPEWFGTWNDKPEDTWFDPEPEPEPQTDPQLIEEVISGLQNVGFKKKDAKAAVLKACEGRVFEDHQSLIEAALAKSNV